MLGAMCYEIATKTWEVGSGLNRGGSAPSLSQNSQKKPAPARTPARAKGFSTRLAGG